MFLQNTVAVLRIARIVVIGQNVTFFETMQKTSGNLSVQIKSLSWPSLTFPEEESSDGSSPFHVKHAVFVLR